MARRPNFLFIMADDLGYADLGCYGGRPAASGASFASCSPSLDRLAREGLRFTHGYANSCVCSPTRFALMTGRWQHRLRGGADEPIRSSTRGDATLGLPPAHPTLPSLLRDAGYATALVGKWHLGYPPHFGPLRSGYQEFFGSLSGGMDYFTHRDSAGHHDLYDGETESHRTGYLTDLISDRAVEFVGRQRDAPFFLSVHYNAPHWPWLTREDEAEARRIEKLYHFDGGSLATYLTMIRQMDEGIGRILRALAKAARGARHAGRVHQRQRRRALLRHLAAGRQEDGPARGRHPRSLHRALAHEGAPGPRHRAARDHHGLGGDVPRGRRGRAAPGLSARRREPAPGAPESLEDLRARALLEDALPQPAGAARRATGSTCRSRATSSCSTSPAMSASAPITRSRDPGRLAAMRARYRAWDDALPKHPDATYSVPATKADLVTPAS